MGALVLCTVGLLFVLGGLGQLAQTVLGLNRHTVTLPATAEAFHLISPTAQMQQALNNAKTSFPANAGVTNVQAGYYADGPGAQPAAALIVGDTTGNPDTDSFFSGFREGAASSGTPVTLAPADTQGMDGRMECGTIALSQGRVGVCAWIDHGTMGVVITTPIETNAPAVVANMLRRSAES